VREAYSGADVRNMLEQIGAKPIAFHASFAKIAGSVTAGVMLSQIFFWSLHPTAKKNRGWFFKTAAKWWEETGLSRSEQETARKRLASLGIVEEHLHGVPARMHFRLNWEILTEALAGHTRELPIEQICDKYSAHFARLSVLAQNRAVKLGAKATRVNYVEVLLREQGYCHLCKERIKLGPGRMGESLTFDHVIALNRGGEHTSANVKPAHMKCNAAKGDDLIDADLQQSDLLFDSNLESDTTADRLADSPQAQPAGLQRTKTGEQEENHKESKGVGTGHSELLLTLPLRNGTEWPVLEEDIKLWAMTYPGVDVVQELREMRQWAISNPGERKTERGIRRHVTGWLAIEQDKARQRRGRTRPSEGMTRPSEWECPKSECYRCGSEFDFATRHAEVIVKENAVFCTDTCAEEHTAWKAEALTLGVTLERLAQMKREQAMKQREQRAGA
jgi:hypothetical protein